MVLFRDARESHFAHAACATAVVAALAMVLGACHRKEKRVLRTEPWPAPMASASAGFIPVEGKSTPYRIESASVNLELPARRKKPQGSLRQIEGTIELDLSHPENSRATLRADLLSLSLGAGERRADPTLLARAFDWLELSADHPQAERDRNRYAVLQIDGFDPVTQPDDDSRRSRSAHVLGHGTLTLHHFRVPVSVELDVELKPSDESGPGKLLIRTRRPLVVSLTSHDILPRDARGTVLTAALSELGSEVGKDARISAELVARPAPSTPNP